MDISNVRKHVWVRTLIHYTNETDFFHQRYCIRQLQELRGHHKNRWYKRKDIDKGFFRANNITQDELLRQYKDKIVDKMVPFALTYHLKLDKLSHLIREKLERKKINKKKKKTTQTIKDLSRATCNKFP